MPDPTKDEFEEALAFLEDSLCDMNPPVRGGHPGCACLGADWCTFHRDIADIRAAHARALAEKDDLIRQAMELHESHCKHGCRVDRVEDALPVVLAEKEAETWEEKLGRR